VGVGERRDRQGLERMERELRAVPRPWSEEGGNPGVARCTRWSLKSLLLINLCSRFLSFGTVC